MSVAATTSRQTTTGTAADPIPAYRVRHLLVGIEMDYADVNLLQYLTALSSVLSIKTVHGVHATPDLALLRAFIDIGPGMYEMYQLNEAVTQELRERFGKYADDLRAEEQRAEVIEGKPLATLLQAAETAAADLVVIGQKGSAGSHGIVAKKLARNAPGDVLIVPENSRIRFERIVVPIDFSPHSAAALRRAVAVAQGVPGGATVTAVHICEVPYLAGEAMVWDQGQLEAMLYEDRERALRAFVAEHAPDTPVTVKREVLMPNGSNPADKLYRYTTESESDLLIMGAKGHSVLDRLLVGSFTERLLATNGQVPVMVVR